MIIVVSDFSMGGSGYQQIMTKICSILATKYNKNIVALGLQYKGEEHNYPFAIVPVDKLSNAPKMIKQLQEYNAPIEAVLVALDIHLQRAILKALELPGPLPYIGLFPLEAPPLCQPWAIDLMRMDERLIMSQFGQAELERAGVSSIFLPLGVADTWRPPGPEEKKLIREGLGIAENCFVILTVADNQERKNLSKAAEIVSRLSIDIESFLPNGFVGAKREKKETAWYLVTRMDSPVGWDLQDLCMRWGIMDRVSMFNRGMPQDKLWALYAAADCFLLTSKAEGLAIPVMEAMACRLPVVGTQGAAIKEHLAKGRGWPVPVEYTYTDPFGNEDRYFIDARGGASVLDDLIDTAHTTEFQARLDAAQTYVAGRSWDKAAEIVNEALDRLIAQKGTSLNEQAETKDTPVGIVLQPA